MRILDKEVILCSSYFVRFMFLVVVVGRFLMKDQVVNWFRGDDELG